MTILAANTDKASDHRTVDPSVMTDNLRTRVNCCLHATANELSVLTLGTTPLAFTLSAFLRFAKRIRCLNAILSRNLNLWLHFCQCYEVFCYLFWVKTVANIRVSVRDV